MRINISAGLWMVMWMMMCGLADVCQVAAQAPDADDIIKMADEVRNPQMDYSSDITVTSFKLDRNKKEKKSVSTFEILVKGKEKTLIKTFAPPIDRGQTILMLGTDMWAFTKTVKQPFRMSLRDRLTGEVANGDIARANFLWRLYREAVKE